MITPQTQCRSLPRPMIDCFENDPLAACRLQQRLKDHVFTVRPCQPLPGQPIIEAVVMAELRSDA
jgi:hypothetical protein